MALLLRVSCAFSEGNEASRTDDGLMLDDDDKHLTRAAKWLFDKGNPCDLERSDWLLKCSKLDVSPLLHTASFGAHMLACKERLARVYDNGDMASDAIPADTHRFQHQEFPGYARQGGFRSLRSLFSFAPVLLFVDDNEAVHRVQRSGLCFGHACALVQHYQLLMHNRRLGLRPVASRMLDLATYLKQHLDVEKLHNYVFKGDAGSIEQMLEQILLPGTEFDDAVSVNNPEAVRVALQKYGPALVAHFKVHEDFLDTAVRRHTGKPSRPFTGCRHAMVLVGCKRDHGHPMLLLQNWSPRKQFVEVDAEYFIACNARLRFVVTPQTHARKELPMVAGRYAESALEMVEGLCRED